MKENEIIIRYLEDGQHIELIQNGIRQGMLISKFVELLNSTMEDGVYRSSEGEKVLIKKEDLYFK